jgi:hypothetical protein
MTQSSCCLLLSHTVTGSMRLPLPALPQLSAPHLTLLPTPCSKTLASHSVLHSALQAGKAASMFTSTASQGSGQETTLMTAVTQLAHHGMIYVPTG